MLIEPTRQARELGARFYAEHSQMAERLYDRYTAAQLQLLLEFVSTGREFNEPRAGEVEAENRAREQAPAAG